MFRQRKITSERFFMIREENKTGLKLKEFIIIL